MSCAKATQMNESYENIKKLPNYYPSWQGCRAIEEFQILNQIAAGTYGSVSRARNKRTNEIVALKRLKLKHQVEGFPQYALREIQILLKAQHPNIVRVHEIVVGAANLHHDVYIVMDYIENDMATIVQEMAKRGEVFPPFKVKCLLQQLLAAIKHLHDHWIIHRDLKTSNLLLTKHCVLKVADFGMSREYGSPLQTYTTLVVTLWYRAPELLLSLPLYSTPIDMWSVGCIFAEILLMRPFLPGNSEIDQLCRIFRELGTPNEQIWPGYDELPAVKNILSQNKGKFSCFPISNLQKRFQSKVSNAGGLLLQQLLTFDPKKRISAESAFNHIFFEEL